MKLQLMTATAIILLGNVAIAVDATFIEEVAVHGEPKRYTYEKYAENKGVGTAVIMKRFGATAVIRCGNEQATAQLTGANDIVTTAAHLLVDPVTCRPKVRAVDCQVHFKVSEKSTKIYKVASELASGFVCPRAEQKWGDDWSVLKLTEKILDVTPYKLPLDIDPLEDEVPVVAVSGAARDFFIKNENGVKIYPRSVQDCRVRFVREKSGAGAYVETDCDTAPLASGGSLLRTNADGDDVLIAVHRGNFEFTADLQRALSEGRVNKKEWEQGAWSAIYVSVAGNFLKALKAVSGGVGRGI